MSTVPVIWAAAAGTPTSNRAAVTHAPQARLAPVASRGATSGATGALPAGPRIHLQGRGGRGVGGGRGGSRSGWRAERDVALDGAPELHEVGVSSPRGEGEHGGRGAVHRDSAGDAVGGYDERHGQVLTARLPEVVEDSAGRPGAHRSCAGPAHS